MRSKLMLRTIESHTTGAPCRHVVAGFPQVPGKTMMEKMLYMKENNDWFRKLVCYEPRGNEHLAGTLFVEPCTPGCDLGILHYEASTWLPMCGGNTFGVVDVAIETGMVPVTEPITKLKIDNPAGVVEAEAKVKDGVVEEISWYNSAALVLLEDAPVKTEEWGDLTFNIIWGGNVFAEIPAEVFGLDIVPENASKFVEIANKLKPYIDAQCEFVHPEFPNVNEITHVEFTGPSEREDVDIKNCTVALPSVVDRCPCGTGTSATSALLYVKGIKDIGETFVRESIIGSTFKCELAEKVDVCGQVGIIPKLTSNASIMGYSTLVLDPKDEFPEGFLLG